MNRNVMLVGVLMSLLLFGSRTEVRADLSGLIGYWQFDGNGKDLSSSGNDLNIAGGAGFAAGLFGQALDLHSNVNQFAARPTDDSIYDFGTSDFTVQVWVNYYNSTGIQVLTEKFSGATGPGWTVGKVDSQWHFWGSPSAVFFSPPQTIPPNVWHQVVVRSSGDLFELFYDGNSIVSQLNSTPIPDTSMPLLVGKRNDLDGRGFATNAQIDEVAIWNKALTDADIRFLYNGGFGNPVPSAIPEPAILTLLSVGIAGLIVACRRRKK